MHLRSAFLSPANFHRPYDFLPERVAGASDPSSPFAHDKRAALQPFSYGPRNCIGKNLAYAEMRLLLAKLLWHFDWELEEGMEGWTRQKSFAIWERGPLIVKLMPVMRGEVKA